MLYRRLEELEEEIATLKRQQVSTAPLASTSSLPGLDVQPLHRQGDTLFSRHTSAVTSTHVEEQNSERDPTTWKTINGLELSPGIIDDCFKLWDFSHRPETLLIFAQIFSRLPICPPTSRLKHPPKQILPTYAVPVLGHCLHWIP
jgi:hypothetical protein